MPTVVTPAAQIPLGYTILFILACSSDLFPEPHNLLRSPWRCPRVLSTAATDQCHIAMDGASWLLGV